MANLPEKMKAVVAYAPHDYRLETIPVPRAGEREMIIKVEACGICAGDLKAEHGASRFWGGDGTPPYIKGPVVPGHEFLGKIVELAANSDVYSNPLHPYTRMLLSAVPSGDPKNKKRILLVKGEARNEGEKGCNFQNRCSYKIDICAQAEPPLKRYDEQKFCACHRGGSV